MAMPPQINDDIKKNLWAYTAAFIDSDGYITMDKNHNPRVGLVATGTRGKAFMMEMHKSLGMGRLHLDQKSPQDTRPVNRLNFYSAAEVKKLLTESYNKGGNEGLIKELENHIFCSGRKISEHDKLPKNLTVEQILIRSSNIGAVRIAQKVGMEKYRDFLNSLDLLNTINFDLEEIGTPLPFRWGK